MSYSNELVVQALGLLEVADAGVGVSVVAADRVGLSLAFVVRTEAVYLRVPHPTSLPVAADMIRTQFWRMEGVCLKRDRLQTRTDYKA